MHDEASPRVSRREFLAIAGSTAALAGTRYVFGAPVEPPADAELLCIPLVDFRASLSVSPFTEGVLTKFALSDETFTARTVADVQRLFVRHGATEVFARIATRRSVAQGLADHGWQRGLERARLARQLGLPFNPELGLFAEYGDAPNYQQPPDFSDFPGIRLSGPWLSLGLDEMARALRQYGAIMARQILATGVRVVMWDIGNEVEFGIAGVTPQPLIGAEHYAPPDAVDPEIGRMSVLRLISTMKSEKRIAWCQAHLWPAMGRLLAATADGIRSVDRGARFSTHISTSGQKTPALHFAFWQSMKDAGYLPDQFGISFYVAGGRSSGGADDMFQWFKDVTTGLKARYGRQSFIAEGGMPSQAMQAPFAYGDSVQGYPFSEQGQFAFNRDMITWGQRTGALAGYRPWAPDLAVPGWQPMSWFDPDGAIAHAKPALRSFEAALPSMFVAVAHAHGGPLALWVRTGGQRVDGMRIDLEGASGRLAYATNVAADGAWRQIGWHGTANVHAADRMTLTIDHRGRRIAERPLLSA
jgi:hypothetical protein